MNHTGLDLALVPGAAARPSHSAFVRPLDAADAALAREPSRGPPIVKRIRDSHHQLARLVAQGVKNGEIAAICGYTQAWVSNMKRDPAFAELVETYRQNINLVQKDLHEKMTAVSMDLVDELKARIDENGDDPLKMPNGFILEAIKTLADRTGHAPISRSVNTNVNVDLSDRLKKARERAGLQDASTVQDAEVIEGSLAEPAE